MILILGRDAKQGLTFSFEGGTIVVPFLISNGGELADIPDQISGLPEESNLYTPFLASNTDGADHFRILADNTFGIEDLAGGGDQDFNDMIFQWDFT